MGDVTKDVPRAFFIKNSLLIHCAGSDRKDCFLINVHGTKKIIDQGIKYKVKKIIFISSCAVYNLACQKTIKVHSKKNYQNNYALSKLCAEKTIREYAKKAKIPFIILRPAAIVSKTKKTLPLKVHQFLMQKNFFLPLPQPCNFFITNINQLVNIILCHKNLKNNSILNIAKTVAWVYKPVHKNRTNLLMETIISGLFFLRRELFKYKIFCKYPLLTGLFSPSFIESCTNRVFQRSAD